MLLVNLFYLLQFIALSLFIVYFSEPTVFHKFVFFVITAFHQSTVVLSCIFDGLSIENYAQAYVNSQQLFTVQTLDETYEYSKDRE